MKPRCGISPISCGWLLNKYFIQPKYDVKEPGHGISEFIQFLFDMRQEFSLYFVIYMDLSLGFVTWICLNLNFMSCQSEHDKFP